MTSLRRLLYTMFALSGAAGLLYELAWSRYLALFVGHSAYAQVLVIGVFLGGMAGGALLVGNRSRSLKNPLLWYALAEAGLGVLGLAFHFLFQLTTSFAYDSVLPAVAGTSLATIAKWGVAVLLILPQSVLLGTTFPLMSAGVLRADPSQTGGKLSFLYFANSFGGAVGLLVGGFVLVGRVGLPGTVAAAGIINWIVAIVAAGVAGALRERSLGASAVGERAQQEARWRLDSEARAALWRLLLTVSFLTAVASFVYEIAWIRMLSLVMGSATHSFELMLSAFILGLAIGSLVIRRRTDTSAQPLRLLGWIQWLMGLTALATLPMYSGSFTWMAQLVFHLPPTDAGYGLFGLGRYGIALAVMLPSTICAGMTLPLITATLLHSGSGERSIGWVYGINTLGSVVGVALAGLLLLPLLGLERMLAAGAALDMAVGVLIFAWVVRMGGVRRLVPVGIGLATVAALVVTLSAVRLDRAVLTGGVFRDGAVPTSDLHKMLFYRDGRTSTVGVHQVVETGLVVLTTNGKPDASLSTRWLEAASKELPPEPIRWQDEATQVVSALTTLAHMPDARRAVTIGHGSGISGHYLLAAPELESLTTVEIEPEMINGSRSYYPANRRVFDDARSGFVIDDAKAYFSSRGERYDLILSEPSNPWVSGTASLFTEEFYKTVGLYLTERGVFAQWMQLYEITDDAVAGVLAALHKGFRSYRGFLAGDTDLLIVASNQVELPAPDWSVFEHAALLVDLRHVNRFVPAHLEVIQLFDRETLTPLLDDWPLVNSDYHPYLDQAAERGRFTNSFASGVFGLASDRFDLVGALGGRRVDFAPYHPVPAWGVRPMRERGISGWLRDGVGQAAESSAVPHHLFRRARSQLNQFMKTVHDTEPPTDWRAWVQSFERSERNLHRETSGVADSAFYYSVFEAVERFGAPGPARNAVAFLYGIATWDYATATTAADDLIDLASHGDSWLEPATLLDGAVVAYLAAGDSQSARRALETLAPQTSRGPGDFRQRLLLGCIERGIRPKSAVAAP
ncbi:MAG: spermidine synthase [Candidatus Krumholzibacteria bacterium]|nr:spermidine synthase [Candidatus Krumholzibacteria bacterium]